MKKFSLLLASAACALVAGHAAAEPLKAAWLYPSPRADEGWSKQHDEAREMVEKQFAGKVKTSFVENVVGVSDAERVIRDLAAQGNKIIFATSFEFMNFCPLYRL